MLKTIIILPDGSEISSGPGNINAIQKSKITEMVNSGEELTIGSVCANSFEATLFTPSGGFSIPAGTEVEVVKEDENGARWFFGVFILEKPTRLTANTMKLVGYDRVSKLDKDLTEWLSGLAGWPYKLNDFAAEVCQACGLNFAATNVPNKDFEIRKFSRPAVTGRQIMRWLGEICCCFCRANSSGDIQFAWYTPAEAEITPTGDSFYFQNGLTYEDYSVAPVGTVQIRLADSPNGALWPKAPADVNSYIISGNPFLTSTLQTEVIQPVLNNIATRLRQATYTPCKVNIPATMNIRAGNTVQITDKNGVTFTAYVMTKTQTGQKETIECTGSPRRDSSSAINNKTQGEKDAAMESVAQNAVNSQTAEDVFNKLTNNGEIKGLFVEDGVWVLNADVAKIINLIAEKIKSVDGVNTLRIDGSQVTMLSDGKETMWIGNWGERAYIYFTAFDPESGAEIARGQYGATKMQIGGTWADPMLMFEIRDNKPCLMLNADGVARQLSWKSNGDGTYSLIGR